MERPPAARQHQFRHLPRWLHAARSGQLQRQAQRGQRRGEPRRRQRQQQLELRRRRPDRRPGDPALRERQTRNLLATLLLVPGRADARWPATKSATRSTATTTPTARTTNSPGSTGTLGAPALAFLKFVKKMTQLWREQAVLHRRGFFQGRPIRGSDVSDVLWFTPAGEELTDEDWRKPIRVAWGCASRAI